MIRYEDADVVRMYAEQKSMRTIARHYGIHQETVRRILRARGAIIRKPGRRQTPATHDAEVCRLYAEEKMTMTTIKEKTGLTYHAVTVILGRNGVKIERGRRT